jgi:SAM-dependent methyltransferase
VTVSFSLEDWCSRIPGLVSVGSQTWQLPNAQSDTALCQDAHDLLAQIEPQSYWFKHRNDVIAAVVRQFPPKEPLFDIGGGNGYVSLGLKKAGFECVVFEPGNVGAATAARRGFGVVRAPFQELQIPDSSLPSAGMFDVLEHIADDAATLRRLHRALTSGGRLYISVPAYQFLWSADDVEAGHFRRYRLGALCESLVRTGFLIDFSTYFFSVLIAPILLMRTVRHRAAPKSAAAVRHDHVLPPGLIGASLRRSFARELAKIRSGRRQYWGASCLVVGRKP